MGRVKSHKALNERKKTMGKKGKVKDPENRVGFGKLMAYKSSDISAAWVQLIMLNYLSIFASDVLGVNIMVVGTLLLASKIVDAFTDLFAGIIIDNTHTRWGKGRPYELCIVGETVSACFLFFAKPEWATGAKYAFIFFMYTLCFSIFATFYNSGMNPFTLRAFNNNPIKLRKVASYGGIITMFFSIVMSVAFPRLLAKIAIGEGKTARDYPSQQGWFRLVAIIMIAATLIGICRFLFVKEDLSIEANDKHEPIRPKEIMTLFKKNKYVRIYALIMLCYNVLTNLAVGSYYFKWIAGNVAAQGTMSALSIVVVPVMLVFPKIMKKMGSMCRMVTVFSLISMVEYIIVFFSGAFLPGVYFGYILGSLGVLPLAYYGILFIMNICNYNEMIGLPRMEGSSGILSGFSAKLGGALGSFITGFLLQIAGYVSQAGVESQPASALMMIRIDFALVPVLLLVVIFFATRYFGKMEVKVTAWEEERKAAEKAAENNEAVSEEV